MPVFLKMIQGDKFSTKLFVVVYYLSFLYFIGQMFSSDLFNNSTFCQEISKGFLHANDKFKS